MRTKYISILLALGVLTTTLLPVKAVSASNLNSNANSSIVPYTQSNGIQGVDIIQLAKAMNSKIRKVDGGIQIYLNNKQVDIYEANLSIYINNMIVQSSAIKLGDSYLIPKDIVQNSIGINCASDGVHVSDITKPSTVSNTLTTNIDGWKNESGVWYYLKNGAKATGWIQDSGKWYYLGTDGKMQVGWVQDGANWYYLNGDGSMAHDTTVGGYYLGSNGAWTTASSSGSSGSVTGISYSELINRIDSLGFINKEYEPASLVGSESAGYGWDWKNTMCGNVGVLDEGGFIVQLRKNNSEFHSAILQIFNWLLPTQGNELNHILATNPQNETLTMDGRTVQIIMYADVIDVKITG